MYGVSLFSFSAVVPVCFPTLCFRLRVEQKPRHPQVVPLKPLLPDFPSDSFFPLSSEGLLLIQRATGRLAKRNSELRVKPRARGGARLPGRRQTQRSLQSRVPVFPLWLELGKVVLA